ncbi:Sensor histidine kinase ComP [compost metagenome]
MLRTNLFRMIRELVNNALKHSGADRILVRIWSKQGAPIVCTISDNGVGFDPQAFYQESRAWEGKHIGLISIGNQVACLGGHLDIRSVPGEGTVITLKLLEREGEIGDERKLG